MERKIIIIKALCFCGIGLCLLAALYCTTYLWDTGSEHRQSQKVFSDLAKQLADAEEASDMEDADKARFDAFLQMCETYPDMKAWIRIPDTKVDYPVMHRPAERDYYLHRNIDGAESSYGVPYLQENCYLGWSDNLIVYGHHMKNGDIFGSLGSYTDKGYWEEHPEIFLMTEDGEAAYEIFAVFKTSASVDNENMIRYHEFVDAQGTQDYDSFVSLVKKNAFYDTGITPEYGEQLLTLSTCEYTLDEGRLVVVARKKES